MNTEKVSKTRIILICTLTIICSAAFAIFVHAIFPASVEVDKLDGLLVKLLGFQVVGVGYFLLLYIQCTAAVRYIMRRTSVSNLQTGVRTGISFALVYLIGMQEVMVGSSPYSAYGLDYIRYEFFMGLGDAIPVFVLCLVVAVFTGKSKATVAAGKMGRMGSLLTVAIIAAGFLIERTMGYETGIVLSEHNTNAIPCYTWTALFGIVLGCIYVIMYPVLNGGYKWGNVPVRFALIIGVNWIIFNSFIGMILKGVISQMLLRSSMDVIALLIASYIAGKLTNRGANASQSRASFPTN
jgi:hypothetical protein